MNFANGEPVVIIRPAMVPDRDNNEAPDWSNTTEFTLAGCGIAPGNAMEELDGRELGIEADFTLFVTPAAGTGIYGWSTYGEPIEAIWPTDRLRFRGHDHDVVGPIDVWQSPFTGWAPGCVVRTKRTEG